MSDTLDVRVATIGDTKRVLNLDVYRRRTAALGAKTAAERREIAGISRSTEYRWLRGGSIPDMELAGKVADRLEVGIDDLIVRVAA